jgi:drug/metabolite transporter (DMT)-like permease
MCNALVWGVSWWPFRQLQAQGLHPLWATALVYLFALVCLLLWRPRAWRSMAAHRGLWLLMLASGLTNVGFNWAVTAGDVLRVVLLFYLMPAWSVLLAWWLLAERPDARALGRLGLAALGVLLVLKTPDTDWPVPRSLPDWLGLMAGFCFALTNIMLLKLRDTPEAARMTAMFGGGAFMAGAAALLGVGMGFVMPLPALSGAWAWMAVALAIAFLLGNLALQYGAARLPAHTTALVMLTEVLFASLSAVALGAATLDWRTCAGGTLIVAATMLAAWPAKASQTSP